jgi:hypothetical protein
MVSEDNAAHDRLVVSSLDPPFNIQAWYPEPRRVLFEVVETKAFKRDLMQDEQTGPDERENRLTTSAMSSGVKKEVKFKKAGAH